MAARVLSVKIDDELFNLLGETAEGLGASRNALARAALEGIVNPRTLRSRRQQRRYKQIRDNLKAEHALISDDATIVSDPKPKTLAEVDALISRLTNVIANTTNDSTKLAAIKSRGRARDEKLRIMLASGVLPGPAR